MNRPKYKIRGRPFPGGHRINAGRILSEEIRRKISESNKNPSEKTRRKMSDAKRGEKHPLYGKKRPPFSEETRKKMSDVKKGEKCHFWKGGISPINQKIRTSLEYRLWRESVFKRDNFTCQWCKQTGGKLNADHIKMFAFHSELRFAIDNGRTLCESCHAWKTKMDLKIYIGKVPELNFV